MADAERIRTYGFLLQPKHFPGTRVSDSQNECQQYCRKLGIPFVDGDYDHALWREAVKGLEHEPERGLRCRACFGVRMLATAKCAQRLGIELFTTTLAGSRWKRLDQIREAAEEAARLTPGTRYWDMNWRKGGLQQRRGELLAQEGFYNQLWCGCEFSMGHLTMRAPEDLPSYVRDFVKQLGSAKTKRGLSQRRPRPYSRRLFRPTIRTFRKNDALEGEKPERRS